MNDVNYSGYSILRNSNITKFCYKQHLGTAKVLIFSVFSLIRKFCYKERMTTANMIPYKRILTDYIARH